MLLLDNTCAGGGGKNLTCLCSSSVKWGTDKTQVPLSPGIKNLGMEGKAQSGKYLAVSWILELSTMGVLEYVL